MLLWNRWSFARFALIRTDPGGIGDSCWNMASFQWFRNDSYDWIDRLLIGFVSRSLPRFHVMWHGCSQLNSQKIFPCRFIGKYQKTLSSFSLVGRGSRSHLILLVETYHLSLSRSVIIRGLCLLCLRSSSVPPSRTAIRKEGSAVK